MRMFPRRLDGETWGEPRWKASKMKFDETWVDGGFHSHGGTPIAGLFLREILVKIGWFGGSPILGHLHFEKMGEIRWTTLMFMGFDGKMVMFPMDAAVYLSEKRNCRDDTGVSPMERQCGLRRQCHWNGTLKFEFSCGGPSITYEMIWNDRGLWNHLCCGSCTTPHPNFNVVLHSQRTSQLIPSCRVGLLVFRIW